METEKIRVLIGKPGLDGHDRGARVIARSLRDAGMEVIYTGLHQMPEQIVAAAIQEDVQVIGLSILSGAHMTIIPRIKQLLVQKGAADIIMIAGGTIPKDDAAQLKEAGLVQEVFTSATPLDTIADWIKNTVQNQRIMEVSLNGNCAKTIQE